jgi:hypothetical protein
MIGWENEIKDAYSASSAEKEIIIPILDPVSHFVMISVCPQLLDRKMSSKRLIQLVELKKSFLSLHHTWRS